MNSITPTNTEPANNKPTQSKCPVIRLLKRIWNAIKHIFTSFINLFKNKPLQLGNRDLQLLQAARDHFKASPPPDAERTTLRNLDVIDLTATESIPAVDDDPSEIANKATTIKDPVMDDFHKTGLELFDVIIDQVIQKEVTPVIPRAQNYLDQLQDYLTEGADLAVNLTSNVVKPLNSKLKGFDLTASVEPDFKQFLNWLTKNDPEKEEIKEAIHLDNTDAFSDDEIITCLKWLLDSHHKDKLIDHYENVDPNRVMDILNAAITVLTQIRIQEFNENVRDTLIGGEGEEGKLQGIVETVIKVNAHKAADQLLARFIAIIENVSFSEAFDDIIKLGVDQSNAILAANAAKEQRISEEEKLLKRCDKAAEMPEQDDPVKDELRNQLVNLKEKVDGYGREKWIEDKGDEAGLEVYKANQICHEQIEELDLILPPKPKADKPKDGFVKALEVAKILLVPQKESDDKKHLFDASAERVINLLLPPVEVIDTEDNTQEIDGLLYLLNQAKFPKELIDIFEEGTYIYKEILTDDRQQLLVGLTQGIKSAFYETIEANALNYAKGQMRDGIAKGISALFQKFIVPTRINDMMGEQALPALQGVLVTALSRQLVSEQVTTYAPLFNTPVDSTDEEKGGKRIALIEKLRIDVSEKLNSFEVDDEDEFLENIITPFVEEIEGVLSKFMDSRKASKDEDREKVIASALNHHFETVYHGSNSQYADLVLNLAFKMGKLGSTAESFSGRFKGLIARELTAATHEMQKSPHYLVNIATKQIKNNYLNKEAARNQLIIDGTENPTDEAIYKKMSETVHSLIFEEGEDLDGETVKTKLDAEICKTAQIAHDFVMHIADQKNIVFKRLIKWAVGGNSSHLETVISRIYHQMLGNTLYTQNMMVRAQGILSKTLQQGAEKLDLTPKTIHRTEKMPDVFSSCHIV